MTVPIPGNNKVECPHCGHFVDPISRCSQCGMLLKKRSSRKRFKVAALLLMVIAVFTLQFCAKNRVPSQIAISSINPWLNFRVVRVEGVLETSARKLSNGAILYVIDDGTGTLAIFSNETPAGQLPMAGSRLSAIGHLSVGVGNKIRMQARCVELLETPPNEDFISEFHLSEITDDLLNVQMTVFGVVSKVWKPEPGSRAPYKIILEDPSGTLEVVHWLKEPPEVQVGDALEVTGKISRYKDVLQLKVWNANGIQLFREPGLVQWMKIGDVTPEMEGQWVIAEGVLGEPRSIPGGVIYPFTDPSGTILALFWDKRISGEERDALDEGVRIHIEAPVVLYKGELELVPEDVGGFQVLE